MWRTINIVCSFGQYQHTYLSVYLYMCWSSIISHVYDHLNVMCLVNVYHTKLSSLRSDQRIAMTLPKPSMSDVYNRDSLFGPVQPSSSLILSYLPQGVLIGSLPLFPSPLQFASHTHPWDDNASDGDFNARPLEQLIAEVHAVPERHIVALDLAVVLPMKSRRKGVGEGMNEWERRSETG